MSWYRPICVLIAVAFVAACGFRPMHATYKDGKVPDELAKIYVAAIPDRVGQQLRNDLIDLMTPSGVPANNEYRLEIRLRTTSPVSVLSTDELANRRNFTMNADYTLTTADGKKELLRNHYRAVTSFDIVDNEVSTLAAQDYAAKTAARQTAEAIQRRLSLYFTSER